MRRFADIRYAGQAYELTVAVPPGPIDTAALAEAFHAEHERTYGYRSDADVVELVNAKVVAQIRVGGGRAQRSAGYQPLGGGMAR